ncbi:hypothetical protein VNO77_19219 [Canavalia gladiata]|uniref:Uncharacterized protein n=1 Tax=Canavalia gladiata TaxID=3824 RepID=A0AAN9QIB1_CANGL
MWPLGFEDCGKEFEQGCASHCIQLALCVMAPHGLTHGLFPHRSCPALVVPWFLLHILDGWMSLWRICSTGAARSLAYAGARILWIGRGGSDHPCFTHPSPAKSGAPPVSVKHSPAFSHQNRLHVTLLGRDDSSRFSACIFRC